MLLRRAVPAALTVAIAALFITMTVQCIELDCLHSVLHVEMH